MSRKRWMGQITEMMDHGDYWVKNMWSSVRCRPGISPSVGQTYVILTKSRQRNGTPKLKVLAVKGCIFLQRRWLTSRASQTPPDWQEQGQDSRVGHESKSQFYEWHRIVQLTGHTPLSLNLHLARWSAKQLWSSCKWHQRRPWWVGGCLPPLTWSNQDF